MNPINKVISKGAGSLTLKIVIVLVAALGGAGIVSSSVFAALTATATNTSGGSITSGTLSLTLAPSAVSGITGGFTTAITAFAPGDTVNRYIELTNGGTLNGQLPTLQLAAAPSNALTTNATSGLQITVNSCSIQWTNTGTCGETSTVVMTTTSATTLISSAQSITLPSVLAGAISHLKVSINLPAGNENVLNGVPPVGTVQGLTTALTWSFTITERNAVTTNS